MNLKSLNKDKILRLILPSIFFFVISALYLGARPLAVNLIAGCFALLFLGNIFWQNIIVSRILGVIFLLGSMYLVLAWLDDVVDGEATKGYIFGLFLILFSISMSVLLIWGYENKKPVIS